MRADDFADLGNGSEGRMHVRAQDAAQLRQLQTGYHAVKNHLGPADEPAGFNLRAGAAQPVIDFLGDSVSGSVMMKTAFACSMPSSTISMTLKVMK